MKNSRWILTLVLMLTITPTFAQESADPGMDPAGQGPGEAGLTAEMQAWMAAGIPNEHHENLSRMAGDWDMHLKMWMEPGTPPMEFTGETHNTMIMGGRFLQSQISTELGGEQLKSMGLEGYDNVKKKHISLFIDNSGTAMQVSEGECSEDGKVITSWPESLDPASGKITKMKTKLTIISDDRYLFEASEQGPDGEHIQKAEINHIRKSDTRTGEGDRE